MEWLGDAILKQSQTLFLIEKFPRAPIALLNVRPRLTDENDSLELPAETGVYANAELADKRIRKSNT